jgi:hypothetical protein
MILIDAASDTLPAPLTVRMSTVESQSTVMPRRRAKTRSRLRSQGRRLVSKILSGYWYDLLPFSPASQIDCLLTRFCYSLWTYNSQTRGAGV